MQTQGSSQAPTEADDTKPTTAEGENASLATVATGAAVTEAGIASVMQLAVSPISAKLDGVATKSDGLATKNDGLVTKNDAQGTNRTANAAGRKGNPSGDAVSKRSFDGTSSETSNSAGKSSDGVAQSTGKPQQSQSDPALLANFASGSGGQQLPQSASIVPAPAVPELNAAQTSAHNATDAPLPQTPAASPNAYGDNNAALASTPALSGAQLIQTMHQSEMRLGMNSSEFGNISISTSLTRQSLSAEISLDHGELGRALALHLPAMQEKLGVSFGLPTRIELRDASQSAGSGSNESAGQGRQEQQPFAASTGSKLSLTSATSLIAGGGLLAMSTPTPALAGARLDITI